MNFTTIHRKQQREMRPFKEQYGISPKKYIALFIYFVNLFVYVCSSQAQPSNGWIKIYGGTRDDIGNSVLQTSDGGFLVAGTTYSFGAPSGETVLIKTDSGGDTLWTRRYGREGFVKGACIRQTLDSGFIITGTSTSLTGGDYDVYLIKIDLNGDTLWTKKYGGANDDEGLSVLQTKDGGYIITGYSTSFGSGDENAYLIKTDSIGSIVWMKTYGGEREDVGNCIEQTFDGGYIIAGYTSSFSTGDGDVYILKTDAGGNTICAKSVGGSGEDEGFSLVETTDSNYIICGYTTPIGTENSDIYFLKIRQDGNVMWTKTIPGDYNEKGYSIREDSNNGYIVVGATNSSGAGGFDVYLIKTTRTCDVLWRRTIGGNTNDYGYSIEQTTDGGYIIAGKTTPAGSQYSDIYLVKTNENGDVTFVHNELIYSTPEKFLLLQNYPNPFNPLTVIGYSLSANSIVSLKVYDVLGREVATLINNEIMEEGAHEASFDASTLSSGVYFYRITAKGENGQVFTQAKKLVLMK